MHAMVVELFEFAASLCSTETAAASRVYVSRTPRFPKSHISTFAFHNQLLRWGDQVSRALAPELDNLLPQIEVVVT
jgi:hypothetical protein